MYICIHSVEGQETYAKRANEEDARPASLRASELRR